MAFPVDINNQFPRIADRAIIEGMQLDGSSFKYPGTYVFDGTKTPETDGGVPSATFGGFGVELTKIIYISTFEAWCSSDTYLKIIAGTVGNGGVNCVVGKNGFRQKFNNLAMRGNSISVIGQGLVQSTAPAGNKIVATASFRGYNLSADTNWGAKDSILILGDSNSVGGSAGSSTTLDDMWQFRVRKWYRQNGNDIRLIDKSVAGQGSVNFETYRLNGQLGLFKAPKLVIYSLGTNDANASTFQANLTNFLNWSQVEWPNVKIIVVGPVPKQGQEATMQQIRTSGQSAVTSINQPNIIFINGGASFDVNDNTMYSTSEANGAHVHLGALGQRTFGDYIINQIQTSHPSFATL